MCSHGCSAINDGFHLFQDPCASTLDDLLTHANLNLWIKSSIVFVSATDALFVIPHGALMSFSIQE